MNKQYGDQFSTVLHLGNFIENENFYSELYTLLSSIQQKDKEEYNKLQDTFIIFYNQWKGMLLASSYREYGPLQTNNLSELLELIQYPLMNTYKLKNKTYTDFNIDVKFFASIFRNNSNVIAEEDTDDNIIILEKFEFTKTTNKLKKFILANKFGIKWEYNRNYEIMYTIFADGKKMKHKK